LVAFVSTPPQYIPVGELDTGNAALVARRFSLESAQRHTLAWNFLSTALKSFITVDSLCSHNTIEQQPGWRIYSGLLRRCVRGPSVPVRVPGTPQVPASAVLNEGAAVMVCG